MGLTIIKWTMMTQDGKAGSYFLSRTQPVLPFPKGMTEEIPCVLTSCPCQVIPDPR